MAFEAQQIYPIDFNKSAAVGIDIPFNAEGVFRLNYTTKAAIKNNLINYFLIYGAIIIVILTWITETNWFWTMIGLSRKKKGVSIKRTNRNWYGGR